MFQKIRLATRYFAMAVSGKKQAQTVFGLVAGMILVLVIPGGNARRAW
jgi:hypothetical protein